MNERQIQREILRMAGMPLRTIALPWPPSALSPNVSTFWAVKARYIRSYRNLCWSRAQNALRDGLTLPAFDYALPCVIAFAPPDKRKRDDDNMIASFKGGRDGVCSALGIDDRVLRPVYFFDEPVKGGSVTMTFGQDAIDARDARAGVAR